MTALIIILSLVPVFLCYWIARHRGADVKFWVIASALVGPIAIPFVFFSRRK
jgi:hypothetical protein